MAQDKHRARHSPEVRLSWEMTEVYLKPAVKLVVNLVVKSVGHWVMTEAWGKLLVLQVFWGLTAAYDIPWQAPVMASLATCLLSLTQAMLLSYLSSQG